MTTTSTIAAGALSIAYLEAGPADGWPCLLMHGFPYDVHAYAEVTPHLTAAGARVIVPFLRGYGATRFLSPNTMRSGEQAALGADLLALLDALQMPRAVLAGYDWGGRAACVVAALWPDRVAGLVTGNSYNIQNIAAAMQPASPEQEAAFWYQYILHSERGRRALQSDRQAFCRYLWRTWSPTWAFDEATFARSAAAFDNPDFVDVVVHSYRHRYGLIDGDPAYAEIEHRLAAQPVISVPAIAIDGADDGVLLGRTAHHRAKFTSAYAYRILPGVGHNMPQEAPAAWAAAILDVRLMAAGSAP